MARDDSGERPLGRLVFMSLLDGLRPSGIPQWLSPVAPVVTQAAVGAGHWAVGRRQRAVAAWVSAAGFGLVAWGLGTEAPTRAEWQQYIEQQKDLLRRRGLQVPATAAQTETSAAQRRLQNVLSVLGPTNQMVFGVRSALRHPRRLTVGAIAGETIDSVFYVLRAARAVQRRRPRTAAGSALAAAGAVAPAAGSIG